jgi:hypothetical protein
LAARCQPDAVCACRDATGRPQPQQAGTTPSAPYMPDHATKLIVRLGTMPRVKNNTPTLRVTEGGGSCFEHESQSDAFSGCPGRLNVSERAQVSHHPIKLSAVTLPRERPSRVPARCGICAAPRYARATSSSTQASTGAGHACPRNQRRERAPRRVRSPARSQSNAVRTRRDAIRCRNLSGAQSPSAPTRLTAPQHRVPE